MRVTTQDLYYLAAGTGALITAAGASIARVPQRLRLWCASQPTLLRRIDGLEGELRLERSTNRRLLATVRAGGLATDALVALERRVGRMEARTNALLDFAKALQLHCLDLEAILSSYRIPFSPGPEIPPALVDELH